jgi:hypothetical protein
MQLANVTGVPSYMQHSKTFLKSGLLFKKC